MPQEQVRNLACSLLTEKIFLKLRDIKKAALLELVAICYFSYDLGFFTVGTGSSINFNPMAGINKKWNFCF